MSHNLPQRCVEKDCFLPIQPGCNWCNKHEIERRARITKQMENILDSFPKKEAPND